MFNLIKNAISAIASNEKVDLETERTRLTEQDSSVKEEKKQPQEDNFVLVAGKKVPVDFKVVQNPLPANCFSKVSSSRKPQMVVTHWDVALSATRCYNILKNLKISTHFCIDNDGTVHQFVDANNVAWHAGPTTKDRELWAGKKLPSWNQMSIGVDFSNAYYEKYQKNYIEQGFGPRPVIISKVNGAKLGPHLGFYPQQIEAYKKLLKFLNAQFNIPLSCPEPVERTNEDAALGKFSGVVNHFNLTRNKIDCAGLPLKEILAELKA